jgi:hypothetical protein
MSAGPFGKYGEISRRENNVFVLMPFGVEELQVVYEHYLKPAIENNFPLNCIRGDSMFGSGVVMNDIRRAIKGAKIVIADLTDQNANVLYELGIADATEKQVLLIAQSVEDVPFDLKHRRVLLYEYSPLGCKNLEAELINHIQEMLR